MCCQCCSVRQQKIWMITIGVLCTLLGILSFILWPCAVEAIINNILPLAPDSWMYKQWLSPPITVYMYLYLFNWTNVEEASSRNVKPHFNQLGPYVFREVKSKEDITWHDNDTMTFYGRRTWFFERNMSDGSLNDLITLPHPPSVVAASQVRKRNRYVKKIMNYVLRTEGGQLAVTKTAEEWLFKGFDDPLVELATLFGDGLVPWPSKDFGFFVGRNASKEYEGTYTIHTGQKDLRLMGEMTHWRGSIQSYAYRDECGRVNGSTGDIFAPARGMEETVSLFIPDACRSINLFPGERKRVRGIDTVEYATNSMTFDSGELYPNMKCFCREESEGCARTGAVDIATCMYGAPMYLSKPHFLDADPSYGETVSGLNPDPMEHGFYVIMEPRLGVPVKVHVNMQFSLLVRGDDMIELFKGVNDFYAPMLIISERGDLDESMAGLVRLALKSPSIGVGCGIALTCVGVVLLVTAIFISSTRRWRNVK